MLTIVSASFARKSTVKESGNQLCYYIFTKRIDMSAVKVFLSLSVVVSIACNKQITQQANTVAKETASFVAVPPGASIGITGDTNDVITVTQTGFVLMGGGTDVDPAISWMLQRSGGGDIVVLRSTGTNAYNDYMFNLSEVNSVETLLIDSKTIANDAAVTNRIKQAEALFISGGDQAEYVRLWKGTLVGDAINYVINTKKIPVGGTSAGCAILGQICFDARNGTVTSQQVLNNPYGNKVTFTEGFIQIPFLTNLITDTHYNNPDRRGRQTGFIARIYNDQNRAIRGIGIEEATAVAIDENGMGKVFGKGSAYFLKADTALGKPEVCVSGSPLTWYKNKKAVSAYIIKGSALGTGDVDIVNWTNFTNGTAQYFSVNKGRLIVKP